MSTGPTVVFAVALLDSELRSVILLGNTIVVRLLVIFTANDD